MTATTPGAVDSVRLRVNGRPVEVSTAGGRRLLDVLRVDLGLTGTKEGCGEGECGACSVLVDGEVVNSCLVPVGQVDGADVETVEGLAGDAALGPLQVAFHERGGTQCGFCTPGILMAAQAFLASGHAATDGGIREAIAGNLCRCTGYTKVVEAIEAAAGVPRAGVGAVPRAAGGVGLAEETDVLRVAAPAWSGPRVVRPRSLADALSRLAADPDLRPVAGGTDVMVALAARDAPSRAAPLLDLWGLDELHRLEVEHDELGLGALTTYAELRRSPIVAAALPVLAEVAASVGAAQIQNRGTVGGNCATASPAGDLLPVLLATDARIDVAGPSGTRTVVAADFWTGYRRTAMAPGELLVAIRIPLVPGRHVRFRKVGTRRAQAISKVVIAVAWRTGAQPASGGASDGDGPAAWHDVRVALGSVAERPIRARQTEAVLEGAVPGPTTAEAAAAAVRAEISPIDDVRSTAAYRREVTGRVLRRIVLDAAG